ncbi:MAG: protein translocase subunit SecF, partial [Phycisphaerae bacterium]|nr:protein translocase subunit SecF [Phycisphaerae bacterium]
VILAILATILVVMFMAIYYTFNGVIADVALLMNLVITLGVMSFLQATFTLPGIAGMVLTLGMAVDANVLIYERMREELSRGVSARMAVKLGYEKAFSAILDSNVTTILTAVILGSLGSEEIKGFGLTLGIGLTISLFTALFVTRRYYHFMTATDPGVEETRKAWLATGVLVAAGAICMGLGYLLNTDPKVRAESGWWGLGGLLLVLFLTSLLLLGSLYTFRFLYRVTGYYKANRLPMLKLINLTNIDWMSMVKYLWPCSGIFIVLGFTLLFSIDKSQYLDIEFLGGTGVQVQIKPERSADFAVEGDEKVKGYVTNGRDDTPATAVGWLRHAAKQVTEASVTASTQGADQYLITTGEGFTQAQMEALLLPTLEEFIVRGGIRPAENGYLIQFNPEKIQGLVTDAASAQVKVRSASGYISAAANLMRGARVQLVEEGSGKETLKAYEIIVTETQKTLVAESLLAAMQDVLKVTQSIQAKIPEKAKATDGVFPIKMGDNTLVDAIGEDLARGSAESVAAFKGGVAIVFDDLTPVVTPREMERRLRNMRLQPDFEDAGWRDAKVIPLISEAAPPGTSAEDVSCKRIAILVSDPAIPYIEGESNESWKTQVAGKELKLAEEALASSRALERVTQFAPQVAQEAVQKAIIAIVLSLIAIAIYVWVRFGSVGFGLGGIISLFHDVATTIAALMICHHIHDTWLGRLLMLEDFKFDLNIIAALLTILGFSINDTIVIYDRIREIRGRLSTVSPNIINNAVNQTLSRTIITSFTVFLCVGAMYFFGGDGIHGFCFAMLFGIFTGTYSTVMIASPILYHPRVMWVTTIVLSALTALLIATVVSIGWLRYTLMVLIVAGALFALVRQWAATAGAREPVRAGVTA